MTTDTEPRETGQEDSECQISGCNETATKILYLYTDTDHSFGVCGEHYRTAHPSRKRKGN